MISEFNKSVDILKALAHPIRLAIVIGLSEGDGCNVNKMVDNLGVSQPIISQQLNILKKAGIIKGYRNGNQICYKVENQQAKNIAKELSS